MKTLMIMLFALFAIGTAQAVDVKITVTPNGSQIFTAEAYSKKAKDAKSIATNSAVRTCIEQTGDSSRCRVLYVEIIDSHMSVFKKCGLSCLFDAESSTVLKRVKAKKATVIVGER